MIIGKRFFVVCFLVLNSGVIFASSGSHTLEKQIEEKVEEIVRLQAACKMAQRALDGQERASKIIQKDLEELEKKRGWKFSSGFVTGCFTTVAVIAIVWFIRQ